METVEIGNQTRNKFLYKLKLTGEKKIIGFYPDKVKIVKNSLKPMK